MGTKGLIIVLRAVTKLSAQPASGFDSGREITLPSRLFGRCRLRLGYLTTYLNRKIKGCRRCCVAVGRELFLQEGVNLVILQQPVESLPLLELLGYPLSDISHHEHLSTRHSATYGTACQAAYDGSPYLDKKAKVEPTRLAGTRLIRCLRQIQLLAVAQLGERAANEIYKS